MAAGRLRVGLLGYGAIGATLARLIAEGVAGGCRLSGVLTRTSAPPRRVGSVDALVSGADLVVEAAGHEALAAYGPGIVARGKDLLVVSAGALVDDALYEALRPPHGGRLLVSSGAIGGLDVLRAARLAGPLNHVSLESTKMPAALGQPWMDADMQRRLDTAADAVEVFSGTAREAAARFPDTANVAATLALATVGLDATTVRVVADPGVDGPRHVVRASGAAGSYEFMLRNRPSPDNPRTSAVTAYALARALDDLHGHVVGV